MTKLVRSDALIGLKRSLGLTGGDSGDATNLEDGVLFQTFDTRVAVARATVPGVNGGSYSFLIENTHTALGSDAITSTLTPYNESTTGVRRNSWPLPVQDNRFEIWLKGISGARILGDAATSQAAVFAGTPNEYIGLATVGAADVFDMLAHAAGTLPAKTVLATYYSIFLKKCWPESF